MGNFFVTHALKEAQDTCLQKQEPSYFSFPKEKEKKEWKKKVRVI
jgi:hypothetical protein